MEPEISQVEEAPVEQPVVDESTTAVAPSENGAVETSATEPAVEKKQDPWKTAFIVLIGVVMLSAVLIYSTSSKRTEPTTALQTDANGQPVQPLNPASGVEEERLAALPPDSIANSNVATQAGQVPGGDGYDPWANGGKPPTGAPIGPGGGYVTIPNGGSSQFMPPECILQPSGIYLCPVPTNANTKVKPTPTPKGTPQNANTQPSPTPATAGAPKATPTPAGGARPTPTPRTRPTAAPAKPGQGDPSEEN